MTSSYFRGDSTLHSTPSNHNVPSVIRTSQRAVGVVKLKCWRELGWDVAGARYWLLLHATSPVVLQDLACSPLQQLGVHLATRSRGPRCKLLRAPTAGNTTWMVLVQHNITSRFFQTFGFYRLCGHVAIGGLKVTFF